LRRAEIEPYAWIINQSLSPLMVTDPVLRGRQAHEAAYIREVAEQQARRTALLPWKPVPPVGPAALRELIADSHSPILEPTS
jgi:arsenite-transporting ATPase